MAIENWQPVLTEKIAEISGLEQVHDYTNLPGSIQVTPAAIIMPISATITYSTGGPKIEYTMVQITIYTAVQILPEGMSQAVPFITKVRDKLAANINLNSNIDQIMPAGEDNWYEGPGQVEYAGKIHIGIIFRYVVKENVTADFTASA